MTNFKLFHVKRARNSTQIVRIFYRKDLEMCIGHVYNMYTAQKCAFKVRNFEKSQSDRTEHVLSMFRVFEDVCLQTPLDTDRHGVLR